jgi:WD40 repeat protein/class 3 adenylate cyclase
VDDAPQAQREASDDPVIRTFLIADIRGYTAFTREHGDAAAARLAEVFAALARDSVEARSGTVIELRGDEALAVFTSPTQATRAALELQAACQEEMAADPTLPLSVGVGIDSGQAVPVEDGFRGVALNMAARLCSTAAAGEVLVSRSAADLAGDVSGIRFEEKGTAELKGFEQPVELLQALWANEPRLARTGSALPARGATGDFAPLPGELDSITPLVDRVHEMHWLRGTWRQARRGAGRLVLVSGPPGIGKTRLVAELADWVHARSGTVRYAGAGGAGTALALAAIRETIEATDPTLLVLNDLEALDAPVIDALTAASIDDRPVMIVGIFRDADGLLALSALIDTVDARGDGHRALAPLDVTGVGDIVRVYAGRDVQDAPVESMWRASRGVPSRVHEVVNEWARDEAQRRLAAAAQWLAAGRSNQIDELEFANNVIGLKLGRLYDVDAENVGDVSEACPYKGLAAFEAADAAYFFGRERLIGELAARTVGVGLLGVVGASGSGKSSAVLAGLVPSLSAGLLPGSERWRIARMRPNERPLQELRTALASIGLDENGDGDLDTALRQLDADGRLVLVVDQAEELFTTTVDRHERNAFVSALVRAADEDNERVIVVLTIRADFYGHCADYPDLARLLAANHVLVGSMRADEIRRAIEFPARRLGVRVESALSDALTDEVVDEPGGLPLLSTTLVELWAQRESGWLRRDTYERSGGLRGAVARLAERSYQQLTEAERATAKAVLLRLVGSGEGDSAVRRRVAIAEFDPAHNASVSNVLDRLTQDRLLTRNDSLIEIAHEALIREWPRLRDWLEEDVQGRAVRAHLTVAAKQWQDSGRSPAELYRGPRLSVVMDWARDHAQELNELEREFVSESRQASERDAERQRRTNRRLRGLLVGVAAFLVLALVAGALALVQRGRARDSAAEAARHAAIARSRELASSAISVLDEDPELTILLANEAKRAAPGEALPARLVTTLHEAVRSMRTELSRAWDRSLPLEQIDGAMNPAASLLAVTGRKQTLQVWDAATGRVAWELEDKSGAGWFSHPQFSPDGSVLAVAFNRYWSKRPRVDGGRAAGIYLLEPRTGKVIERIRPSSSCGWVNLPARNAFTPDGAQLITVTDPLPCRDGAMRLEFVDRQGGHVTRRVPVTSSPQVENESSRQLLFASVDSRRRRLLVSDGDDGAGLVAASTRMIDLASGKTLWKRDLVNGFMSRDGSAVALSAPAPTERAVELVDPATGKTVRYLLGQKAGTTDVAFSADGSRAYTAGLDGTARVWDTATGSDLTTLIGQKQGLLGLSVARNGDRLATFGRDGTARVWDLTTRPLGETMALDLSPAQIGTRAIDAAGRVGAVMAFTDKDVYAVVFNTATGEIVRRFPDFAGQVPAVTPDGDLVYQHLATYGPDLPLSRWKVGAIVVREPSTGAIRTTLAGFCRYRIVDVHPSKDCSVSPPKTPYAEWVLGMSVAPDGSRVVAGGQSFAASVWDADTGSVIATLGPFGHGSGGITSAAISPDGSTVALRVIDDKPRVVIARLDGSTVTEFPFAAPGTSPGQLAFSPDGSLLAVGGKQLEVFDTKTWTPRWHVQAHDGGVFHLDVSPDSRSIVTTGPDGFVRLWDARTGNLIQAVSLGDDYAKAVAFTDNRHVVVGTLNGLVAGLTFDVDELLRIARSRVTRTLTDLECRTYLHRNSCPT